MGSIGDFLQHSTTYDRGNLSDIKFAEEYFLNPNVPYGVQDDPDGSHHFKLHVSDPQGNPIEGIKKDQPIPLRLRDYQRNVVQHENKWRTLRFGRRCVVPETPVLMSDGSYKPMKDIEEGERVACRDSRDRVVSKPVEYFHDNGVKDVYEVRLSNGRSVTCTANHPLLSLESRGYQGGACNRVWKSIEEGLSEGDRVVCSQKVDRWGDVHDPELAKIVAYMITDGYMNGENQTPKLVNTRRAIIDEMSDLIESRYGFPGTLREKGNGWELHLTDGNRGTGNPVTEELKEIGVWGRKAARKELPDCVYEWDKETFMAMYSAMISGDGTLYRKDRADRSPQTYVTLCSQSEELLNELRLILMKGGINGLIHTEKRVTNKSGGEEATIHYLRVGDAESIRLLLEGTGTVTGKEEEYKSLLEAVESQERDRYRRTKERWMHVTVDSIEHKGKRQTYDIEVKDHHNFIADGIVNHNTGKSFLLGVEVVVEALRNSNAQVLVLAPNQSHVKVLFDDYIRPLLRVYKNDVSGEVGIPENNSGVTVGEDADFVIDKSTQKPQEIVLVGQDGHRATIRGMVISDSARGQSASKLIFDEADYADTELVQGIVAPIIMTRPNTQILMSSTPTGRTDSFFYDACHDDKWKEFHETFEVLPHYDQDLYERMAKLAGGENSNTFKQEYLAQWGSATAGVFDQQALNKSFIISPDCKVLEKVKRSTKDREPLLAMDRNEPTKNVKAHYDAVERMDWRVRSRPIGSKSVYRPAFRGNGVVTAGTDWNEEAGMQTILIWWPPNEWLKSGKLKVARFPYDGDGNPDTSGRDKDARGKPKRLAVGKSNGDPGGPHDLRQVEGIVIWHGRLEGTANFNWTAAANRVAGLMSVPSFIDSWYVDKGYGQQVNQMVREIMASGEYRPDQKILSQSQTIPDPLVRNMNKFHPERDSGKTYKPVDFSKSYEHEDFDYLDGRGNTKAVMVNLARRMISEHKMLIPYGELVGYYEKDDLGNTYEERINSETAQKEEVAKRVTDDDKIEATGGQKPKGDTGIGGLINQMQGWHVDGYSPTGKPRFTGIDHTIDAFMLAVLSYMENHSQEREGNMFNEEGSAPGGSAENVLGLSQEASKNNRPKRNQGETVREGDFTMKEYDTENEPFDALVNGHKTPEEVGTSLDDMLKSAAEHYKSKL